MLIAIPLKYDEFLNNSDYNKVYICLYKFINICISIIYIINIKLI